MNPILNFLNYSDGVVDRAIVAVYLQVGAEAAPPTQGQVQAALAGEFPSMDVGQAHVVGNGGGWDICGVPSAMAVTHADVLDMHDKLTAAVREAPAREVAALVTAILVRVLRRWGEGSLRTALHTFMPWRRVQLLTKAGRAVVRVGGNDNEGNVTVNGDEWREACAKAGPIVSPLERKVADDLAARKAKAPIVTPDSVLAAAAGHMKDRASTYDKPAGERSMRATVTAFNAMTGHALTEEQGWLFMETLKMVRSQQGAYRDDNYEDAVAYAALRAEAASQERNQ